MADIRDFLHPYRWLEKVWPRSYWIRTITDPNRYTVRFIAAADRYRLDCHSGSAQLTAGRLIWFGLLLSGADKVLKFIDVMKAEQDRIANITGGNPGYQTGEVALDRACQHLTKRAELLLTGYQLAVQADDEEILRAFLSFGEDHFEAVYPRDSFAERLSTDVGIVFADKDLGKVGELFRLEADLFEMSFGREGGDLEQTSKILLDLAVRLAKA